MTKSRIFPYSHTQMGKVVCVTGASGFIASWLVKLLLQRGYTVKATITNLHDPRRVAHLKALEGADERLHLYEANLLVEGCFDSIVDGCDGVFHTASPVFYLSSDPQKELIDPAVKGTMNVLKSCKKVSIIKRVVVTSSMATITHNNNPLTRGVVMDETWHSDIAFCEGKKEWYALSNILAEKATWKFGAENDLDLVTLHPGFVIGPPLQMILGVTCGAFLDLIKEGKEFFPSGIYRFVDVRDVALANILALENPSASGRYILVGGVASSSQVFDILGNIFPSYNLPSIETEKKTERPVYKVSQDKAKSLGIKFRPLEVTIKDSVERFRDTNLITF